MSESIVFYNKGGRPKKFSTPEEAHQARLDAKKKWRNNNKERISLYNQLKTQTENINDSPQQERAIVVVKKSKKHSKRHSKKHSRKRSKKHSRKHSRHTGESDSESDEGVRKLKIKKIGKGEYRVSFIFRR